MARISTVSGPVNTLVRESDSPSRSMLSTVARIWQNSSVAPSVSTIATLPVVGSVGLDVSDESPSPPPPQAANVTNAAAVMLSRATRSNEMLLETDIDPSLMMSPYDMMNPYDCEPESTNSDTFRYLSPDMSNRPFSHGPRRDQLDAGLAAPHSVAGVPSSYLSLPLPLLPLPLPWSFWAW